MPEHHPFPSKFCNRFYVSDCGEVVRLSFGELFNGREEMHTSLTLLRADALALLELLNQIFPQPH
jgi:hypothetical protein